VSAEMKLQQKRNKKLITPIIIIIFIITWEQFSHGFTDSNIGSNGENSVMMLASSMKPKGEGEDPWKTRKKVEHGREKKKKQITKGELRRGRR
jgi:hypothetical protein